MRRRERGKGSRRPRKGARQPPPSPSPYQLHGLARWISKFGLMSRAEAERAVSAGRVMLNGKVVTDPERACHPERDRIAVEGRPLRPARKVYIAMHKPRGYITTSRDPAGRPTAYDLLPPGAGNVQAVGRLDADTSGLLLFTNDTELAARISGADGGVEKVYHAVLDGEVLPGEARQFEAGVKLDGKMTLPARCRVEGGDARTTRVELTITEGRNRQIRRMWEIIGHRVLELHRTRIGPIELGTLPEGRTRPVSEFERATLLVKEARE